MVVQLIRDAVKLSNDHMKKVKFLSIEFFLNRKDHTNQLDQIFLKRNTHQADTVQFPEVF